MDDLMQHSLRRTELGNRHLSKHALTASSTSCSVAKYRLWVANRRASFRTRSMGASCRVYGGRNSRDKTRRCSRRKDANSLAWWYLALSSTMIMRLPRERWRRSIFRKTWNVSPLNTWHMARTNLPVPRLTAPKQATDLRVGACSRMGSLISGATHIRQREPCCWKWHSSKLHSSRSFLLAQRRSFFYRRNPDGVGLSHLGSRFAQAEAGLSRSHRVSQAENRDSIL